MLRKIYQELVEIRKELQAIRSSKESPEKIKVDGKEFSKVVEKSTRDSIQEVVKSFQSKEKK